jgi:glycosyltransferase involved in cell wall biosynthesis
MLNVVVIDMQPITPPVGGGRQRLLGLYHGLGDSVQAVYLGSYDWPGESLRDMQLTPSLREICVPLSDAHFDAAAKLSAQLGGATVIDSAFSAQVKFSPEFVQRGIGLLGEADVVVFSHPWAYTPLADYIRDDQMVVYDAHNVESVLKTELLDSRLQADDLLREVVGNEFRLCQRSNLVLTCSHEDADAFGRLFDLAPERFRVVPNGAFTDRFGAAVDEPAAARRKSAGIDWPGPVAVFMGSAYGPNNDAARYVADVLAPRMPACLFIIIGSVGEVVGAGGPNVLVAGTVDEARRDALLVAADVALNPIAVGSGTNVKMFDYMAAGLPVLSTDVGCRGICDALNAPTGIAVEPLESFAARLGRLLADPAMGNDYRASVRRFVSARFSWEAISRSLGELLREQHAAHGKLVPSRRRIGMFSYLADAFGREGVDLVVLGNLLAGHVNLGYEADIRYPVVRFWNWDNRTWRESGFDEATLRGILAKAGLGELVIQHHSGFLPEAAFRVLVATALEVGLRVIVEMHDSRSVPVAFQHELLERGATLVLHAHDEAERLGGSWGNRVQVIPLPVRVPKLSHRPARQVGTPPVIGGFGFLRPYKGLLQTVRVVARLSAAFPGITYRGYHAVYPSDDSEGHLRQCLMEADRLGVREQIQVSTDFLDIDTVVGHLQEADVLLLPYEPSEEGASAAGNMALASGTPLVTSDARIFRPVAELVSVVEGGSIDAYARAVKDLLDNPMLGQRRTEDAYAWLEANSYDAAARRFITMLDNG